MKSSIPILLLSLLFSIVMSAGCRSPFREYPDEVWPERIGEYSFQEAVSEMGPPDKRAEMPEGDGFSASWVTYRAYSGSQTLVLNFDQNGELRSWNSVKAY